MNFFISILLLFTYTLFAEAAEWTVDGKVNQYFAYDDNVTLTEKNQVGSFSYTIIPEVRMAYDTEKFDFSAMASYGTQKYANLTARNLPIQRYNLSSSYQTGRNLFAFDADYTVDPNSNVASTDTGNFESNSLRNRWTVSPSYFFQLTELDSLQLSGTYYETTYTGDESNSFSDNEVGIAKLGWNRIWNERLTGSFSISYGHFLSLANGLDNVNTFNTSTLSDVYGIDYSGRYALSENWKVSAGAGLRLVESKTTTTLNSPLFGRIRSDNNNTDLGWDADLDIVYTGEQLFGSFIFHRGLSPSGNGFLNNETSINLNLGFNITERLVANLTSTYILTTLASINNDNVERNNFDIGPSIDWAMARDWMISASYRYRFQRVDRGDIFGSTRADSNLVMLSLGYNWDGFSFSR